MARKQRRIAKTTKENPEQGMPGGGKGRTETPGRSGVYPVSELQQAPAGATIHGEASWGQGARGAAGYEDHGESELFVLPGEQPAEGTEGAPK